MRFIDFTQFKVELLFDHIHQAIHLKSNLRLFHLGHMDFFLKRFQLPPQNLALFFFFLHPVAEFVTILIRPIYDLFSPLQLDIEALQVFLQCFFFR